MEGTTAAATSALSITQIYDQQVSTKRMWDVEKTTFGRFNSRTVLRSKWLRTSQKRKSFLHILVKPSLLQKSIAMHIIKTMQEWLDKCKSKQKKQNLATPNQLHTNIALINWLCHVPAELSATPWWMHSVQQPPPPVKSLRWRVEVIACLLQNKQFSPNQRRRSYRSLKRSSG